MSAETPRLVKSRSCWGCRALVDGTPRDSEYKCKLKYPIDGKNGTCHIPCHKPRTISALITARKNGGYRG